MTISPEYMPRGIVIYCDAEAHEPVDVETLWSRTPAMTKDIEVWSTHVSAAGRQALHHRDDDPNERPDMRADRTKLVCPECGDDLTIGDLLGVGVATLFAARDVERGVGTQVDRARVRRWLDRHAAPHRNLTALADAGVSRLSMSGLRCTLSITP